MKPKDTKEKRTDKLGTTLVLGMAVFYLALGLILFNMPKIQIKHICYLAGVLFVLAGIVRVAEYFIKENYKNINQYGFSMGVLLMAVGICIILKNQELTGIFTVCLAIGLLLTAIVKVQYAMDLRALADKRWYILLTLAAIMVVCATIALINPFATNDMLNKYTYIIMIIDGIISIGSTIYLAVSMRQYDQRKNSASQAFQKAAQDVPNEDSVVWDTDAEVTVLVEEKKEESHEQ